MKKRSRGEGGALRDPQRIEVQVAAPEQHVMVRAFVGRWLVVPDAGAACDSGVAYGVALTDRGNIAVYVRHNSCRWASTLDFYDRLDDIPSARLPADVNELAARALGQRFVVLLEP